MFRLAFGLKSNVYMHVCRKNNNIIILLLKIFIIYIFKHYLLLRFEYMYININIHIVRSSSSHFTEWSKVTTKQLFFMFSMSLSQFHHDNQVTAASVMPYLPYICI